LTVEILKSVLIKTLEHYVKRMVFKSSLF